MISLEEMFFYATIPSIVTKTIIFGVSYEQKT